MTDTHRTALLTACVFAQEFVKAADAELRGDTSARRQEAQEQLIAAFRNIPIPWCAWCGKPTILGKNGHKQACPECAPRFKMENVAPMPLRERLAVYAAIERRDRMPEESFPR